MPVSRKKYKLKRTTCARFMITLVCLSLMLLHVSTHYNLSDIINPQYLYDYAANVPAYVRDTEKVNSKVATNNMNIDHDVNTEFTKTKTKTNPKTDMYSKTNINHNFTNYTLKTK